MQLTICPDPQAAAVAAAERLAELIRAAAVARGKAVVALSGGETPWLMLGTLRQLEVPWDRLHIAQVDERVAPADHGERNLTRLAELLVADGPLAAERLLAMPVTAPGLERAALDYQRALESIAGRPATLDVVHLGLGADGHTASLVPDDGVLAVDDRDVAVTGPYAGRRRMTLTFPALRRARERLWLVTGRSKATALRELLARTGASPAVQLPADHSSVFCDAAAGTAGNLSVSERR